MTDFDLDELRRMATTGERLADSVEESRALLPLIEVVEAAIEVAGAPYGSIDERDFYQLREKLAPFRTSGGDARTRCVWEGCKAVALDVPARGVVDGVEVDLPLCARHQALVALGATTAVSIVVKPTGSTLAA